MAISLRSANKTILLYVLFNGEKYSRQLRDCYEKETNHQIPLSTLYDAMSSLEAKGLVRRREPQSIRGKKGNSRRYYYITGKGIREVNKLRTTLNSGEALIPT